MIRSRPLVISTLCAVSLLSACAPSLSLLPASPKPLTPPPAPPVVVCTASMMADVPQRPPLPADAGFPAPQTPSASAKVQSYLTWLHSLSVTTNTLIQRATETKAFCASHQPK